jgi:hypothetical protein
MGVSVQGNRVKEKSPVSCPASAVETIFAKRKWQGRPAVAPFGA